MTGAPGTRLTDFRREHPGRPWPPGQLLCLDVLVGLLATGSAVALGTGRTTVGVVLLLVIALVPTVRWWAGAVPDEAAEAHRRWLRTALPAADPAVQAVVVGAAPPKVGWPGTLVVRVDGQLRAVTVEHRSTTSGPVVTGPATGAAADRLLRIARDADELTAAGIPVPEDISAGDGELDVIAAATVLQVRREHEAAAPEPPSQPPSGPPRGSLEDALRMADALQRRFAPRPAAPPPAEPRPVEPPPAEPPPSAAAPTAAAPVDPFVQHARELAGLPPDDIAPGETRLFSTARLQHPDGWHTVAYEGTFTASTAAGIRWRARRPVVAALVDADRRQPHPPRTPALDWQGDVLVVRVDGLAVEQVTPVDGWYDVPLLPGTPWHVLPLGERAGEVHHGSMESALADAQRALDAQAAARRAAEVRAAELPASAPPAGDPTRPARRRPFLVSCAWMGLTTDVDGRRTARHAVEGTPVGLEDGPDGGAPTLRWWTTSDGVAGLLLAVRDAWLRSTPPGAPRTVPGITWRAGRTAVSFQHGDPATPWVTLEADADGRFWVPPLGAPWELLGPGEGAATVHPAQGRSESVVRLDPER